jgi:molybdate transport system permease protein
MDLQALALTLRLAAVTTIFLMALSLPLAWWLARAHSPLRSIVESLTSLPLLLPPTVLGFYLLVLLGPTSAPGSIITKLLGHPLAFTFNGLVVGSILYSLPFAVQPLVAGLRALPAALLEDASLLGASPARVFLRVALPLARTSVVTAALLAFMHTVGEFGVVLMLGGNIPGRTRTVSIALYDQVQQFDYASANRTALVLLVAAFAALLAIYSRRNRNGGRLV